MYTYIYHNNRLLCTTTIKIGNNVTDDDVTFDSSNMNELEVLPHSIADENLV
jgi:hypothetical protein